ncbi:MAG TPA: organic hydroperoxide resistance protein [Roseiflexaceae bacterium]|nr:organic hydroperoxide resistance protein [Roseiflexaceae bacterium]
MSKLFATSVTATGGRDGKVTSEDGVLDLEVRLPKELGGKGGHYTNPEQLFAAGYAACFDSAITFVARMQKQSLTSRVTATVGLERSQAQALDLVVALDVQIDGVDRETAERVLEAAHAMCPYSRAIRNNVDVQINLVVEATS